MSWIDAAGNIHNYDIRAEDAEKIQNAQWWSQLVVFHTLASVWAISTVKWICSGVNQRAIEKPSTAAWFTVLLADYSGQNCWVWLWSTEKETESKGSNGDLMFGTEGIKRLIIP